MSPYDTFADGQTTFPDRLGTYKKSVVSITPSTANGLVFCTTAIAYGVLTGTYGTAGQILDSVTYRGETANDVMDNADGYSHLYNRTTSEITFGFEDRDELLAPDWAQAIAIAFEAAEPDQ